MKFCVISPITGLEKFATFSEVQFALAHIQGTEYWDFFSQCLKEGQTVILDNGAYEKGEANYVCLVDRMSFLCMKNSGGKLVVTLPDYLLQAWDKTWHASIAFLDTYDDMFPGVEWMYVPQSVAGDEKGWFKGLVAALEDSRIKWIGLPRCLGTDIMHPESRINVARYLQNERLSIKVHALGLQNGNYHEIPFLADAGVYSIDSSAPVWRGWHGFTTFDPKWTKVPDDFGAKYDPQKEALIISNLRECGVDV